MLFVNVAAVADFYDGHFFAGIVDGINDAVIVLAYAVVFFTAGEGFAAVRAGLGGQRADPGDYFEERGFGNAPHFFFSAFFDENFIRDHHASGL